MDRTIRIYICVLMALIFFLLLFSLYTEKFDDTKPLQTVELTDSELENWQKHTYVETVDVFFDHLVVLAINNAFVHCVECINKNILDDSLENILDLKDTYA